MRTILAGIDFSDLTDRILEAAAAQAKAFGATVYLVHAEPPEPDFVGYEGGPQHVRDHLAHVAGSHHGALHALRDRLREQGIEAHALLMRGPTVDALLDEARRLPASLIVLGSHGHGALVQLLLGSVSSGVLHQATCPVLIVPLRKESAA